MSRGSVVDSVVLALQDKDKGRMTVAYPGLTVEVGIPLEYTVLEAAIENYRRGFKK